MGLASCPLARAATPRWLMAGTLMVVLLACSRRALAQPVELVISGDSACDATEAVLVERIEQAIVGEPNRDLRLELGFVERQHGVTATVKVHSQHSASTKELAAETCADAVAAVVAVAALALSSPTPPAPVRGDSMNSESVASSPPPKVSGSLDSALQVEEARVLDVEPSTASTGRGLSLSTGVEWGTQLEPTFLVGLGLHLPLTLGEIQVRAWYGASTRSEDVSVDTGTTRQTADMAAGSLEYCADPVGERWLLLCAGVEAGWTWRKRLVERNGERLSHQESAVIGGPTLSTLVSYPADSVRPELRLSARVPNLGGLEGTRNIAFLAALGAGVPF